MARPLRIEFPGAVYHVMSRGNALQSIFLDDHDRELFLEILYKVNQRYNWRCHAYCLMGNHYHLLVETVDETLSKGMRYLNGIYAQKFNRCYERVGHLFQGRYKAILVDKNNYLLELSRYIVLNPVRAEIVDDVELWSWSSYRGTSGMSEPHRSLSTCLVLSQLADSKKEGEQKYQSFVCSQMDDVSPATDIRGQLLLGSDEFVEEVRQYLEGTRKQEETPKRQRFAVRPELCEILEGVVGHQLVHAVRGAVFDYGYSQREIATFLNVHYSTVSRMVNRLDV